MLHTVHHNLGTTQVAVFQGAREYRVVDENTIRAQTADAASPTIVVEPHPNPNGRQYHERLPASVPPEGSMRFEDLDTGLMVTIAVGHSDGVDGAFVVQIDTNLEPDASDGGPGLRVLLNDGDLWVGVPYQPDETGD